MVEWIGSAVIAVVISSIVTVLGWYIALRHERLLEAERRRERVEDIQTALLADIRSTSHRFLRIDADRQHEELTRLVEDFPQDRSFTPFVPSEPGSLLWSSIAQEVHILPNEVIDAVVLFFSQLETIRCFVDDLRSDAFASLDPKRKAMMLQDYVRMAQYLVTLANEAERVLARSLGIDAPDQ